MKRTTVVAVTLVMVVALVMGVSAAMAAKPDGSGDSKDVISISNGFPSGAHETLNIHGKNDSYVCVPCDPDIEQCNVVNMPEYGEGTITYVSGKKVKIDELTVFDSCTESFDGDPAEVWLPYEAEGYYVFARALGKPAKGNPSDENYEPRSIIIENDGLDPLAFSLFGDVSNPDEVPLMMPLGLITQGGAYELDSTDDAGINLVRFDSEPEGKGRGKTQGKDITDMFMWTGWVFQPILDTDGDGDVDYDDVPASYDTNGTLGIQQDEFEAWLDDNTEGYVFPSSLDLNEDGVVDYGDVPASYDTNGTLGIQQDEFEAWLNDNLPSGTTIEDYLVPLWSHYDTPIWVFSIADLVYKNQVLTNDGIKNLQIRFYPVATTEYSQVPVE